MKKPLLALALSTLLLGGLATAAAAEVIDQVDAVPSADEAKLDRALSRLGSHSFVVEFVNHADQAPSQVAKQLFRERGLGDRDGVIVVAVQDKRVGVYLGRGFEARGVTDDVISMHNKTDFIPYARKGQFARGAAELAKGLVDAGASGTPAASGRRSSNNYSNTYSSNDGGRHERSGGGFPWGLVIMVALAGGGIYWWMNRGKGDGLPERLEALRGAQGRIVSGALKLAEIDQLARFQDGDMKKAYLRLAKTSNGTLERARSFGDRFDDAEAALKAKKYDQATKTIVDLEREVDTLEPAVAAALTALEGLEAGGLTGAQALAQAELPQQIEASSRRMRDMRATYDRELKRGKEAGVADDPQFAGALEDAQRYLTTAPVDINRAEAALAEADEALARYKAEVDAAAQRKAEEARARADQAASMASTAANVAFLSSLGGHEHHHHHHYDNDSSYSSGGFFSSSDNDSSSNWSSGSSSDDSWGSSSDSSWDSGGSSWDSGSSSDNNW